MDPGSLVRNRGSCSSLVEVEVHGRGLLFSPLHLLFSPLHSLFSPLQGGSPGGAAGSGGEGGGYETLNAWESGSSDAGVHGRRSTPTVPAPGGARATSP